MNTLQARPHRWTIAELAALDDEALDQVAHRAVGNATVGKLILGRIILAAESSGLPRRRGLSGAMHYAIVKGIELYEARECRRVADKLEGLPQLRERAEDGRIGWAYLREITRVASEATEGEWMRLCERYSSRRIQKLVKRTRAGESPLDPDGEGVTEEPTESELRVILPAELMQMLSWISRELSSQARRRLPLGRVLECLVAEHLAGSCFPEEKKWARLEERARNDLAAQREQERREFDEVRQAEKNARFAEPSGESPVEAAQSHAPADDSPEEPAEPGGGAPPVPWEAVAAREVPCPGQPALQLAVSAPPHWENAKLRFNPEARHPSEAQRAEVVRRDAYACSTPGCPNHLWLAVHHVVFYCQGGVTLPGNLITVCSACHRQIHEGLLRVTGEAPGGLRWSDSGGSSLLDHRPEGWFGWDLGEPPEEPRA